MEKLIYLDNAATTKTRPEVVEAMLPYFTENFWNPSSVYTPALNNRKVVDESRETIARSLGTTAENIYFTAGGSESDNWALKCTAEAYANKGKHIITSKIEHHAILHTCEYLEKKGFEITYIDVDENGILKLDDLKAAIRPDTILISVMFANNEIGTIQPIKEIGAIAKEHGILFHTDAVQAYAQIPINVDEYNIDMLSVSGHKFGLVYPGLGWVCWKGKEYLPEEMSFSVNYLGANITQVGLNFSRPAAQILGQYYQFIRLGFQGYKEVQYNSLQIAKYIHSEIAKMVPFVNYSEDVVNPLFIWYLKPEYAKSAKWTLYDLQDKLSQHGWMVPAYTLPSKLEDYVVMRVVVRQGFSRDMADMLLGDINNAIAELEKLEYPTPTRMAQEKNLPVEAKMFNHGGRRKTVKK